MIILPRPMRIVNFLVVLEFFIGMTFRFCTSTLEMCPLHLKHSPDSFVDLTSLITGASGATKSAWV